MSRHHKDGNGVHRNLAGLRFAPPVPEDHKLALAAPIPTGFVEPDFIDVPVYDELPVVDQGGLGDCTGQATARVAEAKHLEIKKIRIKLSALFGYSMTRGEEGENLTVDSGCMITDALDGWVKRGLCLEELWPTIDDGKQFTVEPSDEAKANALEHQGLLFFHAPNHHTIIATLAQGYGLTVGISCFENMMSEQCANDGIIRFPEKGEKNVGGHNLVIRGWDAKKVIDGVPGAYFGDNSWSDAWGCKTPNSPTRGHFYVPRRYVDAGLISECISARAEETP